MAENNELIVTPTDIVENKDLSPDAVEETKNQIRVFLIAQARKELERVVKLTETLDKMQEVYQERALRYMEEHDDDTSIVYLPQMMGTITTCLETSYSIINKVVGNEKIMNFQVIQNNVSDSTISIGSSTSSYTGTLEDPVSRERVRTVLAEILKDVKNADVE